MSNKIDEDIFDAMWAVESEDPAPRSDGKPGPPDNWDSPSWFDHRSNEWWWTPGDGKPWRLDPPPVKARGHNDGIYTFVTAAGEQRDFTASALFGRSGLADLFLGDMRWPVRHYPARDKEGNPTKRPNATLCMEALIRWCRATAYLDEKSETRKVGIWASPDGRPIVHAGDRVFVGDEILPPGSMIGATLYALSGRRAAPSHIIENGRVKWQPASTVDGLWVCDALNNWNWTDDEARELYAGARFVHMLADAPRWKVHQFIQAPPEAGKTTLLHFTKALGGGSTGPMLKTFSKALIEQAYSNMGLAVILDEVESDLDPNRIKHLFELFRLLSDDGAVGGRGSASGKARTIDVHGPITMAATVRERWRPQDRRRITLLQLRPLLERVGGSDVLVSKEEIVRLTRKAAELSPALRARAIACFDLLQANFKMAHGVIIDLGGTSGDGDQLGWQIAGWRTLTSDRPPDEAFVDEIKRFKDYIRTLAEDDESGTESEDCLNFLFSSPLHGLWKGGQMLTIGQFVARGREEEGSDAKTARGVLLGKGLRLIPDPDDRSWSKALLAIANKHAGLEEIFSRRAEWGSEKWNQVMDGLPGARRLKRTEAAIRFSGSLPTRALLVPAVFLPKLSDEEP